MVYTKPKLLVLFNGIVWDNQQEVIENALNILSLAFEPTAMISTWKSCQKYCVVGDDVLSCFHDDVDEQELDRINFPYTQQLIFNPQWRQLRLGHYANFVNVSKALQEVDLSSYDYIAKTRSDLFVDFAPPSNLVENYVYSFPTYWGGQNGDARFLNDHFLLGRKQDILDVYRGVCGIKNDLSRMWNPEMYMRHLVQHSGKEVELMESQSYFIKKGKTADSYLICD